MSNHTFLLLKGPDNLSYLAKPYPEAYSFCSNSEVFSNCYRRGEGERWWVKPFMYPSAELYLNEYGTKSKASSNWWGTEVKGSQDCYNWEWDGGLVYSSLNKFKVVAKVEGEANPDGVFHI